MTPPRKPVATSPGPDADHPGAATPAHTSDTAGLTTQPGWSYAPHPPSTDYGTGVFQRVGDGYQRVGKDGNTYGDTIDVARSGGPRLPTDTFGPNVHSHSMPGNPLHKQLVFSDNTPVPTSQQVYENSQHNKYLNNGDGTFSPWKNGALGPREAPVAFVRTGDGQTAPINNRGESYDHSHDMRLPNPAPGQTFWHQPGSDFWSPQAHDGSRMIIHPGSAPTFVDGKGAPISAAQYQSALTGSAQGADTGEPTVQYPDGTPEDIKSSTDDTLHKIWQALGGSSSPTGGRTRPAPNAVTTNPGDQSGQVFDELGKEETRLNGAHDAMVSNDQQVQSILTLAAHNQQATKQALHTMVGDLNADLAAVPGDTAQGAQQLQQKIATTLTGGRQLVQKALDDAASSGKSIHSGDKVDGTTQTPASTPPASDATDDDTAHGDDTAPSGSAASNSTPDTDASGDSTDLVLPTSGDTGSGTDSATTPTDSATGDSSLDDPGADSGDDVQETNPAAMTPPALNPLAANPFAASPYTNPYAANPYATNPMMNPALSGMGQFPGASTTPGADNPISQLVEALKQPQTSSPLDTPTDPTQSPTDVTTPAAPAPSAPEGSATVVTPTDPSASAGDTPLTTSPTDTPATDTPPATTDNPPATTPTPTPAPSSPTPPPVTPPAPAHPGPASTSVRLPDGTTHEAPNPQAAQAARNALANMNPSGDAAQAAYTGTGVTLPSDGKPLGASVDPTDLQAGDVARWDDKTEVMAGPDQIVDHGEVKHLNEVMSADSTGFEGFERPTDHATDAPAPDDSTDAAASTDHPSTDGGNDGAHHDATPPDTTGGEPNTTDHTPTAAAPTDPNTPTSDHSTSNPTPTDSPATPDLTGTAPVSAPISATTSDWGQPVDPGDITRGDIAHFTDHTAEVISPTEINDNGHITKIADVLTNNPTFQGFYHPPTPPAAPHTPAPDAADDNADPIPAGADHTGSPVSYLTPWQRHRRQ